MWSGIEGQVRFGLVAFGGGKDGPGWAGRGLAVEKVVDPCLARYLLPACPSFSAKTGVVSKTNPIVQHWLNRNKSATQKPISIDGAAPSNVETGSKGPCF